MSEDRVKEQYNRLAQVYDTRWKTYISGTLTFMKRWLDLSGRERLLDVGCGTGELERRLLEEKPDLRLFGVDLSEKMLAVARRKLGGYPNIAFCEGSAGSLPFASEAFDRVLSANSFHYFPEPLAALKEMHRVLKPGGSLVIMDWCRDFWVCKLFDIVLKAFDPAHRECYTRGQMHGFLNAAGFRVAAGRTVRFKTFWGLMIVTALRENDGSGSFPVPEA